MIDKWIVWGVLAALNVWALVDMAYRVGKRIGKREESFAARERAHRAFLNGMGMGVAMMADRPPFVGDSGPIAEIAEALDRRGEAEATQSVSGPRIVEES